MQRQTFFYLSVLRTCACLAIVVLHTMFLAVGAFSPTQALQIGSMVIRNCCLWAAPCFVMVTGALLLDPARDVTYRRIWRRYLVRVLLAILVFTILYELVDMLLAGAFSWQFLPSAFFKMITNGSWSHMWYLYLVAAIYLMLPFYRMIAAQLTKRDLTYLLVVYLVFLSVLPLISTVTGTRIGFYIFTYSVYPFYLFLGDALHRGVARIPNAIAILLILSGTIALVIVTVLGIRGNSELLQGFTNNYSFPAVIAQVAGIFALARNNSREKTAGDTNTGCRKFLLAADAATFGIYLLHMVLLRILFRKMSVSPYQIGGIPLLLLIAVAVFAVSWGLVYLFQRITRRRREVTA